MIFPSKNTDLQYVIHEHTVGDKIDYQLSIETETDELQFLRFPRTGNMATISDSPNVTRLFGELSEDTRSREWLTYHGTTRQPEFLDEDENRIRSFPGVYKIISNGNARIGEQTAKYSEVFFDGKNMSDRWILRKMPNPFDKSFLSDNDVYLFWKPPKQKPFSEAFNVDAKFNEVRCACGVQEMSAKFHDLSKQEGVETLARFTGDISFNQDMQTFEGVGAAEGTWIDMFGIKYVYTSQFIIHTFNKQRDQLSTNEGIPLNTNHPEDPNDNDGKITEVKLGQHPINHIIVNGVYTGPTALTEGDVGLSYEFRLRSVWNEDFQAWVPFDSITEKLSVVDRPACKICWINKVN